jgi:hypothetical protein
MLSEPEPEPGPKTHHDTTLELVFTKLILKFFIGFTKMLFTLLSL